MHASARHVLSFVSYTSFTRLLVPVRRRCTTLRHSRAFMDSRGGRGRDLRRSALTYYGGDDNDDNDDVCPTREKLGTVK